MKNNIMSAARFLNDLGIRHQICHDKGLYPFKNQEWEKLHEDYENVTGLKIRLGDDLGNDKALYCFDIDCKGQEKKGEILLSYFLNKYPYLKDTYIEKTKSNGYHIFIFSSYKTYKETGKIIFIEPYFKDIETNLLSKKLEIEFFCDYGVTIAPTKTYKGNYKALNKNGIQTIKLEDLQKLLKDLRDNSKECNILQKGNSSSNDFSVTDQEVLECVKLLELNNIRYKVKNKKVHVWANNDISKNGDYILNNYKILWNFKTNERIKVAKFIIRENGKLIEEVK